MQTIPEEFSGVLLFTASWSAESCESARQICQTACSRAAIELLEITESEETEGLFDAMQVEVVPSAVRMSRGRVIARVSGVNPKDLLTLITKNDVNNVSDTIDTNEPVPAPTISSTSPRDYKSLVNGSKLMLFIKGTPSAPQCGFTRQLISLLSANGLEPDVHYSHFNILSNNEVREGLKKWAEWPTYPQIYWKGELLGGLDILREMFAAGQMAEILAELRG